MKMFDRRKFVKNSLIFLGGSAVGLPLLESIIKSEDSIRNPCKSIEKSYIEQIKENIDIQTKMYSNDYKKVEFIVENDGQSFPIQNLFDTISVQKLLKDIRIFDYSLNERPAIIHSYITSHFKFIPEPFGWPTVEETLSQREGDCNSLSMLFMSAVIASGFDDEDVYAGINNNHMWPVVKIGSSEHNFETDLNPCRKLVYSLHDFYVNPVYKIYKEYSLKRIRKR